MFLMHIFAVYDIAMRGGTSNKAGCMFSLGFAMQRPLCIVIFGERALEIVVSSYFLDLKG